MILSNIILHFIGPLVNGATNWLKANEEEKKNLKIVICKEVKSNYKEFREIRDRYNIFLKEIKDSFIQIDINDIRELEELLEYIKNKREEIIYGRDELLNELEGFTNGGLEELKRLKRSKNLYNKLLNFQDLILNYFKALSNIEMMQNGNLSRATEFINIIEMSIINLRNNRKNTENFKQEIIEEFNHKIKLLEKKSDDLSLSYGELKLFFQCEAK